MNYAIFPLAILFLVVDEAFIAIYIRIIAGYEELLAGQHAIFGGNDSLFWIVLGVALLLYLVFYNVKYFFLNLFVLNSTEALHKKMLHSLLRSPCSFFDVVSTGELNNKFSNDLGILDEKLALVAFDALEGTIFLLIAFGNIFQIDLYFIIPGSVHVAFILVSLWFAKRAIIVLKEMDLAYKSPIFNIVNETIFSLTQIRIYGRRLSLLKEFVEAISNTLKINIQFWNVNRVYAVYISYFSVLIIIVGFLLGIANIIGEDAATVQLYLVSVIFFISFNEFLNFFLRQFIQLESIMVSSQRSLSIIELEH